MGDELTDEERLVVCACLRTMMPSNNHVKKVLHDALIKIEKGGGEIDRLRKLLIAIHDIVHQLNPDWPART